MKRLSTSLLVVLLVVSVAWADFPAPNIVDQDGGTSDAATSHTINLPSNLASGNLLFIFFTVADFDTSVTTPSGWTLLYEADGATGSEVWTAATFFKTSDGGEGATTTITTGDSAKSSHTTFRITGHHTSSNPEAGTTVEAESATPDPPSVTASWGGSEDNLWIVAVHYESGADTSTYPTNYTDGRVDRRAGEADSASTATAVIESAADTEDPGTFGLAASREHGVNTVVVRPAGAAAAARPKVIIY